MLPSRSERSCSTPKVRTELLDIALKIRTELLNVSPGGNLLIDVGEDVDNRVRLVVGKAALLLQATKGLAGVDERGHDR